MAKVLKVAVLGFAWLCAALAVVGVFVPVLPTTPLLLLATFLFAKFSPRCHRLITSSKVYRAYVMPFKEAGGMPLSAKVRLLLISYAVLGLSAVLVQKPFVWAILGAVAVFLLWLVTFHIPTVGSGKAASGCTEVSARDIPFADDAGF